MNLFRVTVEHGSKWDRKKKSYYAVAENKEAAVKYIETHMRAGCTVGKVAHLGYELGSRLFAGGKERT